MEPCATYQNTHHQLTVVIGSQWGNTCWPFRFKLMSNIKDIDVCISSHLKEELTWAVDKRLQDISTIMLFKK